MSFCLLGASSFFGLSSKLLGYGTLVLNVVGMLERYTVCLEVVQERK